MTRVATNGIELEVEVLPPPGQPAELSGRTPVLLIMGLAMQLTAWPDALIQALHERGRTVIRFDNRDIGLSSKLEQWGRPRVMAAAMRHAIGLPVRAPYTIDDMANDTVGMLDALGAPRAHVVGVSMGGMIGQVLAARHAGHVASFTCVMSTSGARYLPGPTLRARRALISRPANPHDLDAVIDHFVGVYGVIGSPGFPTAPDALRERIAAGVRRSHHPVGSARQLVAIAASGDRSKLLQDIVAPTVVVHGRADPLVPVAAAHDLGRKIPGATVRIVDGMGHDLAPGVLPSIVAGIDEAIGRAEAASAH